VIKREARSRIPARVPGAVPERTWNRAGLSKPPTSTAPDQRAMEASDHSAVPPDSKPSANRKESDCGPSRPHGVKSWVAAPWIVATGARSPGECLGFPPVSGRTGDHGLRSPSPHRTGLLRDGGSRSVIRTCTEPFPPHLNTPARRPASTRHRSHRRYFNRFGPASATSVGHPSW
jgi:hypothetical protein